MDLQPKKLKLGNHLGVIKAILNVDAEAVDIANSTHNTALHIAAYEGCLDIIKVVYCNMTFIELLV